MNCPWCGRNLLRAERPARKCLDVAACMGRVASRIAQAAISVRMERIGKGLWIDG